MAIVDYETFGDDYLKVAERVAGRSEMIWFRTKDITAAETYEKAARMRELLPEAFLILSERADLATACGFDGVHLNKEAIGPEVIEEAFPELITGYSAHSLDEIRSVQADYFTLSPIFKTFKYQGIEPLGAVDVTDTGKKVYALGGVDVASIPLLYGKGYYGYAGIGIIKGMI